MKYIGLLIDNDFEEPIFIPYFEEGPHDKYGYYGYIDHIECDVYGK